MTGHSRKAKSASARFGEHHDSPRDSAPVEAAEQGYAMVTMLSVVVILGVLITIVLSGSHGPTPISTVAQGSPATLPQSIASAVPQSRVSACEADFQSVDTALGTYRALNGAAPASGTGWATSAARGGPFMQSWPSGGPDFSITWNGSELGVVPAKGAASHGSYGTNSPATGCFAP